MGSQLSPKKGPQTLSEVTYNGKIYNIAREGTAEILDLKREADPQSKKNTPQSVFYNPIQQYNRDLSVLAIRAFGDDLAIIRKARHERRGNNLAQDKPRGQKRKRQEIGSIEAAEEDPITKSKSSGDIVTSVGMGEVLMSSSEEASAQDEALSSQARKDVQANEQKSSDMLDHARAQQETVNESAKDSLSTEPSVRKDDRITFPQPSFRILDALSATGLRALRYAKEIPEATTITANDLSSSATASIKLNAEHNKLSHKINPTTSDANEHMQRAAARTAGGPMHYHVIDLDPYGTAAPFLDAAVRALVDGGLLCVTCTDAGVFASLGYLEKTYSQYGGLPLKGAHAHESGLRLILHAIATSAARYGLAIEPLLSLSIDFYARIFVRIHHSPAEVKFLASKTMVVYNCDAGCGAWSIQHLARKREKKAKNGDTVYSFSLALAPSANTHCEHCGFKTHQAGPMWGGPLHNPHFIRRILDMVPTLDRSIYGTIPRLEGMLTIALHETLEDPLSSSTGESGTPSEACTRPIPRTDPVTRTQHPFFFLPSVLSGVLHCISPSDAAIRGALIGLGYRATRSHTKASSVCTDAPWSVIWEVMGEWIRQGRPIKEGVLKKGMAGWEIMKKDRRNAKLLDAKMELRQALESDGITDVAGLKKEVEAALYRLSKPEQSSQEHENGGARGVELQNHTGAQSGEIKAVPDAEADNGKDGARDVDASKRKIEFNETVGRGRRTKGMVSYQVNPRPDWGPMTRAKEDY